MKTLKLFRLHPEAITPTCATERSACFDIHACLKPDTKVTMWFPDNHKESVPVTCWFELGPGERALIPTGFIFGIPEGYSLRIHPRSGIAIKSGINLANCEGVVDEDYPEQTYVALTNNSEVPYLINDGDRIAQGEIVPVQQFIFENVLENPVNRTNRVSGVGSTGR